MKVSIITATFNSEKNIEACLQSVYTQNYNNIEHIIIDGGSDQQTIALLKKSAQQSKWITQPDLGIYDALNKGIQLATGDLIGFLHSDDLFASHDVIGNIVNIFKSDNQIHGVYGNLVYVNKKNKTVRTWNSKPFKQSYLDFGWTPPHPTLFLREDVYQKHGLFDTSFKIAGDYDFMLRILKDNEIKVLYVPNIITKMKIGGVSNKNLGNIITKSKEDIIALRKNGFTFPFFTLAAKNIRKLPQLFKR